MRISDNSKIKFSDDIISMCTSPAELLKPELPTEIFKGYVCPWIKLSSVTAISES